MNFFKHFTDAHRGQSILAIVQKFGFAGVGRFWFLTELCAEKMSKQTDESYTEAHCHFEFNAAYLMRTLGFANLKQQASYLEALTMLGLCSAQADAVTVSCYMPKLLECLDRDVNRARKEVAKRENKEIELDKEIDTEGVPPIIFDFEIPYFGYPRKIGKAKAFEVLRKTIKTSDEFLLFEKAVSNYALDCVLNQTPIDYIKHFSSFVGTKKIQAWRDYVSYAATDRRTFNNLGSAEKREASNRNALNQVLDGLQAERV